MCSAETASKVDYEVLSIIKNCHKKAKGNTGREHEQASRTGTVPSGKRDDLRRRVHGGA